MVFPDFGRDAKFRAKESGSQFGNQFLASITGIAETLRAEIPVQTALGLRPVGQLVQCGRVITLLVPESLEGRKLHHVPRGCIERAITAVPDGGVGAGNEGVRVCDALR
jgi:hypothetical protein